MLPQELDTHPLWRVGDVVDKLDAQLLRMNINTVRLMDTGIVPKDGYLTSRPDPLPNILQHLYHMLAPEALQQLGLLFHEDVDQTKLF